MGGRKPVHLPARSRRPADICDERPTPDRAATDVYGWWLDPTRILGAAGLFTVGLRPAYIIHDWLFEQHHCRYSGWAEVSFEDSARILGEVIDTLMLKGDVPPNPEARSLIVWMRDVPGVSDHLEGFGQDGRVVGRLIA